MAKPGRKSRATAEPASSANQFLDALKFVGAVTKDVGPPQETHVTLIGKTATAWNGIVAAGAFITEDIRACPNNRLLIEALSKCGEHISITQLDTNRLSIKSAKFKALVPCIEMDLGYITQPDPPIAVIDDRLKKAFDCVSELVTKDSQNIATSSILLNGKSLISTNAHIIFEYWHGVDLPSGLAIPKDIVAPLVKCPLPLCRFGFSQSSVTFYFENGSWLKSQLYSEDWPSINGIMDKEASPVAFPSDFWTGLDAVASFTDDGFVYFDNGVMRSHPHEALGASYDVQGLPKGPIFQSKYLKLIKPYVDKIDWFVQGPHKDTTMAMFYGPQLRGALMGRVGSAPDGYGVE